MINYKGKPLLGEDSSVSNTSEFFAIAGTILFWLIFLIFSFVIKPQPKKQYKEVQIVLSSTPVVQKSEEAPAPAEAASASAASEESQPSQTQPVVETPVVETPTPKSEPVQKTVETPAPKKAETPKPKATTQPKKEPAKAQTQPKQPEKTAAVQKPAEPVYAKTVEELMAEQFSSKSKEDKMKDFDKMFDDDEPEETPASQQTNKVHNTAPAISGTAGTAAASDSSKVTSTSTNAGSKLNTASGSTTNALEGIRNSTFKGNAANGVQSETSAKTKNSGSGKVEMEMSNGRSRALLNPERPVINLSAQAAATIDASITVSISFKVNEKGNVSGITISPASAFKDIVKQEITGQLLDWLFEPADYSATATFEYKIVKK